MKVFILFASNALIINMLFQVKMEREDAHKNAFKGTNAKS